MKLKTIDGEQYLDRESVIFFADDEIPEEYQDATKYEIYVHPFNRRKVNDNETK